MWVMMYSRLLWWLDMFRYLGALIILRWFIFAYDVIILCASSTSCLYCLCWGYWWCCDYCDCVTTTFMIGMMSYHLLQAWYDITILFHLFDYFAIYAIVYVVSCTLVVTSFASTRHQVHLVPQVWAYLYQNVNLIRGYTLGLVCILSILVSWLELLCLASFGIHVNSMLGCLEELWLLIKLWINLLIGLYSLLILN